LSTTDIWVDKDESNSDVLEKSFTPEKVKEAINTSIINLYAKLKKGGILYLDATAKSELDRSQIIKINTENLKMIQENNYFIIQTKELIVRGHIDLNETHRTRYVYQTIHYTKGDEYFTFDTPKPPSHITYPPKRNVRPHYLLTADDLEAILRPLNPKKIWRPQEEGKMMHEINYDVICAIK
jgi:hypothetical protein